MPLSVACDTDQKVKVTATPVSSSGRPAQLHGPLRITVQSGNGTFTQDPATPNEFYVVSPDEPGATEYLVQGDADLGEGETLIQDTVSADFTSATATSFGLSAGPAEPK